MPPKINKSVLITDLDNTLFDWVDYWYASFHAMILHVSRELGAPVEQLIPEIRSIHKKYGTSEYAYLLEEMDSLKSQSTTRNIHQLISESMAIYYDCRRSSLKLYPSVMETLK